MLADASPQRYMGERCTIGSLAVNGLGKGLSLRSGRRRRVKEKSSSILKPVDVTLILLAFKHGHLIAKPCCRD